MSYVIIKDNDKSRILDKFDWNGSPVKKALFHGKSFSDKMFTFTTKPVTIYYTKADAERYIITIKQLIKEESARYENELLGSTEQLLAIVDTLSIVNM